MSAPRPYNPDLDDDDEDQGPKPSPMTEVEAFAFYQANEAGVEVQLIRTFESGNPPPASSTHWELVMEGVQFCHLVVDGEGHIQGFEFNFSEHGSVNPVSFLISVIDWLSNER